jgi:putrescine transport system substrate-binding protein
MAMRVLATIVASALLAACGGRPETAEPTEHAPAGPAASAPVAAEEAVLNVYNWSDYMPDEVQKRFEQETGIRLVYDVYDSNEMLEAKLMAGASGYDVVFPSARPFAQRHIQSQLYLPLDKSKLPNWKNLDAAILKSLEDVDPGNAHLMPYMWGTTGIGYNVDAVTKRLGGGIDSWAAIFDPAQAAKLKDCGISVLDDQQEGFGASLIYLGRDPNGVGGGEVAAVTEVFGKARPFVRYFNSSKYIDDLANGEICVAMGYNGDVLQARDRAAEANNNVQIAYAVPKEGALRWVDSAAIPVDAPHPANAHVFINYLMQPDVIAAISNYVAYANANSAATAQVDAEVRDDPGIYPSAEVVAKLTDPRNLPNDESRARERAWTTIKSGQ